MTIDSQASYNKKYEILSFGPGLAFSKTAIIFYCVDLYYILTFA